MKLSELIKKAAEALAEHGDLECLTDEGYSVMILRVKESDGKYPDSWNMPKGYKFVEIGVDR